MPPISPIMMIASVCGSSWNSFSASMAGTGDRVAADTDTGRLTEAGYGRLCHGFVGQGAGTRHDADTTRQVDVTRHDADLAFARVMMPGQLGPIRRDRCFRDITLHFQHVECRHAFGDGNDQLHAGIDRFDDGISTNGAGT